MIGEDGGDAGNFQAAASLSPLILARVGNAEKLGRSTKSRDVHTSSAIREHTTLVLLASQNY